MTIATRIRPLAKTRPASASIDRHVAIAYAHETLSRPPRHPYTERHEPKGEIVCRFVLPLELCHPQNTSQRHRPAWAHAKDRSALLAVMSTQLHRFHRNLPLHFSLHEGRAYCHFAAPLSGRPQVLAIRFSCNDCDEGANWAKQAIDLLQPTRTRLVKGKRQTAVGLGIIAADDREACEQRAWGEWAPKGKGFCLIEVYEGGTA